MLCKKAAAPRPGHTSYRHVLRPAGFAAALVALSAATLDAAEAKPPRPNVLFIAIDDLRDWVGYLGHPQVKTPNLDRLAARGVAFTRSYCASPLCNPSRAALLSGLRACSTGVYNNDIDWRKVLPDTITLPLCFKNNGYYVAGAGKIYHERFRRDSDWHDYLPKSGDREEDNLLDKAARRAGTSGVFAIAPDASNITIGPIAGGDEAMIDYHSVSHIIKKLEEKHERPFFLACGLKKPHLPWTVPKKYFDLYPLETVQMPRILESDLDDVPPVGVQMAKRREHEAIVQAGKWKEAVQAYLATISFCDAMIGRLLDAFDRSGHADDTIL